MPNNYILKNKNNQFLHFYYSLEKCIYCTIYEEGCLINSLKVIQDVESNFSVDFYKNGDIYILCTKINGDVILCKEQNNNFIETKIFKLDTKNRVIFKPLINKTDMTLIYNLTLQNSRSQVLVKKHIGYNQISDTLNIDYFTPFNTSIFKTQKITDDHMVILYQKRERENILGYRELTQNKTTSFNIFHKTQNQIVDQSFLATKDCIHFIYIVKSLFFSQVIYRRRDENGLSKPIILYEGTKVRSCSLGIIKGVLYAFWSISNNLFFATSYDLGVNFCESNKNIRKISHNSIKVDFISFNSTSINQDFIFTELYVDKDDFSNIQFLKSDFPDFFYSKKQNTKQISLVPKFNIDYNCLRDNFLSNFEKPLEDYFDETLINNNINTPNEKSSNLTVFSPETTLKDEFDEFSNFTDFNKPSQISQISNLKGQINNMKSDLNKKNNQIQTLNNIIELQTDENTFLQKKVEIIKQENLMLKDNFNFRKEDGGEEIKNVEEENS